MATCANCGESGFLLRTNELNLCESCTPTVAAQMQNCLRIFTESMNLVSYSDYLPTRVSRITVAMDQLLILEEMERRGIRSPLPKGAKATFRECQQFKEKLILESLNSAIEKTKNEAQVAQTARQKIGKLSKVLLFVKEQRGALMDSGEADKMERMLLRMIEETQLNDFIEKAEKCEFKGQKKKAIDQYFEALYFLKRDATADQFQKEQIDRIQKRIDVLSGKVAENADRTNQLSP